jgi:fatty-acyl-CoA synthase
VQRKAQLATAAHVLETAIPLAERTGVAIGLETHDAFSSAARVADVLALVDSPWVGAVWDSHHPYRMGETPAEVYDLLAPRLLNAAAYQGWISVEWEKHWHPEIEDPELALPQHLTQLHTWLSEFNPANP